MGHRKNGPGGILTVVMASDRSATGDDEKACTVIKDKVTSERTCGRERGILCVSFAHGC